MARGMTKNLLTGTVVAVLAAATAGCQASEKTPRTAALDADGGKSTAVADMWTVRIPSARGMRETSAAAMSTKQSGVLFTITDSGNEPRLFAVDTTGALRGVWSITGATNVDWEAVTIGTCSPGKQPSGDCV